MALPPIGATSSLLTQLEHVRKVTGKTPSQLEEYESKQLPKELAYIYLYFQDFYNGDQFSYTELQSWQKFIGFDLAYWEAELIRQLCLERLAFDFKRQQDYIKSQKGKK
jgi:hypothetical protein